MWICTSKGNTINTQDIVRIFVEGKTLTGITAYGKSIYIGEYKDNESAEKVHLTLNKILHATNVEDFIESTIE